MAPEHVRRQQDSVTSRPPEFLTLGAFAMLVVLIAANPLAVSFTDRTLAPFWGAGTRIAGASLLFLGYVALRRVPLPRGRDWLGVLYYGVVQFGFGFGLGYWALVKVPANIAGVMLAAVPLFTLLFASLSRTEPMTLRGASGALISLVGIAVIVSSGGSGVAGVSPVYLFAMAAFTASLGAGLVIAKRYSGVQPAVMNAGGMVVGGSLLLGVSYLLAEPKPVPTLTLTWAVQLYVIAIGSVVVFALMLFVVRRWTATAVSYQAVLSPPITIMLSALLLREPVGWPLVAGTAIVLVGVYVGAILPVHCREALRGSCAGATPPSTPRGSRISA